MLTVLAFLIAIGVLVTIHEFGHYLAARACGVTIIRFSIGFGRAFYRYQRDKDSTEWVVSWLPLGGYVKMLDSREAVPDADGELCQAMDDSIDWSKAFDRQPVLHKMLIVFAGPLANLLLAFLLYWLLLMQGEVGLKPILGTVLPHTPAAKAELREGDTLVALNGKQVRTWQDVQWILLEQTVANKPLPIMIRTPLGELHHHLLNTSQLRVDGDEDIMQQAGLTVATPPIRPVVGEVLPGSVAQKHGLQSGDVVLSINQKPITDWQQVVKFVRANPSQLLKVECLRGQQTVLLKIIPEAVIEHGQRIGRLGAGVDMRVEDMADYIVVSHYSVWQAASRAASKMAETIHFTLKMIGRMVTGQASIKAISGPLSIADAAGHSAAQGWQPYVAFIALLSISIAVMNLLPIPVLDGGHLMYHMIEMVRGEPLPNSVLEFGQRLGLGLLGALMVIAFFNDISRYIVR